VVSAGPEKRLFGKVGAIDDVGRAEKRLLGVRPALCGVGRGEKRLLVDFGLTKVAGKF
jgi:hypothetical protein